MMHYRALFLTSKRRGRSDFAVIRGFRGADWPAFTKPLHLPAPSKQFNGGALLPGAITGLAVFAGTRRERTLMISAKGASVRPCRMLRLTECTSISLPDATASRLRFG